MHPIAARPSGVRAEPNVTPMIDVMLVLLIIFMAVGPLLETGFRAEPPSARHAADRPDEGRDLVIGSVMSLASAAGAHVVGLISAEQARDTPVPR